MTPKEKADELVDKMYDKVSGGMKKDPTEDQLIAFYLYPEYMSNAKQCALIAVDEIMKQCWDYRDIDLQKSFDYWQEVKHEIKKL
jgi:hypothetical protein